MAGGKTYGKPMITQSHIYDLNTKKWIQTGNLPVGIWGMTCWLYKGTTESEDKVA